jgi:hypothetical protein
VLDLDFLHHLQRSLNDPMMDDDSLRARLEENYALLEAFAQSWQAVASEEHPELNRFVPAKEESPMLNLAPARLAPTRVTVQDLAAGADHQRRVVPAKP